MLMTFSRSTGWSLWINSVARPDSRFSPMVERRWLLMRRSAEKLLSAVADVTGRVRKILRSRWMVGRNCLLQSLSASASVLGVFTKRKFANILEETFIYLFIIYLPSTKGLVAFRRHFAFHILYSLPRSSMPRVAYFSSSLVMSSSCNSSWSPFL